MPKHPRPAHPPPSAVNRFIDPEALSTLLKEWVPEKHQRRFLVRCLVGEGPVHHRGANYVLLMLLSRLVSLRKAAPLEGAPGLPVPMRLPPHLREEVDADDVYPLELPTAAIERLAPAGSREFEAMVDCLMDGPPQHAVANVVMVQLLESLLRQAEAK